MAGGMGILGGYGLRYRVTATRQADIEEFVHRLANQSLQMDSSGNVDISGVINIASAGGIFQGTGTFASPTTGLKIYSDGTDGVIELWDASAKAFSLTHTKLLFGSNVAAAATTALAVFAENATYNSESLGAGDVLMGDNSSNKANLLWDKSAGKLQLRGGTTMQCEIGTDGKLYAGGGNVALDSTGLWLVSGTTDANKVIWISGTTETGVISSYRSGSTNVISVGCASVDSAAELATAYISAQSGGLGESLLTLYQKHSDSAAAYASLSIDGTTILKVTGDGATITGEIFTAAWADYGSSSTITGFSTITNQEIRYKKVGKLVVVSVMIVGTSDATTLTFTVPYATTSAWSQIHVAALVVDNGTVSATPGRLRIDASSSTITVGRDFSGDGGFTASGTKQVRGQFWYQIA